MGRRRQSGFLLGSWIPQKGERVVVALNLMNKVGHFYIGICKRANNQEIVT
jgi:hypothetical protein